MTENSKKPSAEEDLQLDIQEEIEKPERPEEGISTYIGKSVQQFFDYYGNPDRTELSYYGYTSLVYNSENTYMIVGEKDGTVSSISVAGTEINIFPFHIGENLESVYKKYTMRPEIEFTYGDGVYRFELFESDLNIRPLLQLGDIFAQLYFDNFTGELLFVRFLDKESVLLHRPYDLTYRGTLVESDLLTEEQWDLADRASEKQIFELTNLIRKRYSISTVHWDEDVRVVAYEHSKDMYETETFSHVSKRTGDLSDRLRSGGHFL
ncbi:CAP-associated domain-containing protein [Fervidibacillus halotolerans]|uniref:CAP-associated domain-containing protein n=1 Tax=Fervidibacillus halotolerans TaxID=2980027 RepID=A0A9E8S1N8_9BACI|nr:CAP-associated domain-containing protein [Fervidibacillus halotolerans]WAA13712.1 CAP-associated domain-containing protein [Fervidibacillus halotolerans]